MKTITLRVEDKLYEDLKQLVRYKGEQSFLLRRAIKNLIDSLKEVEDASSSTNRSDER